MVSMAATLGRPVKKLQRLRTTRPYEQRQAPSGLIKASYPVSNGVDTITSGSFFSFTYNGAAFPNKITVNAWINDPNGTYVAIGQTQLLPQTPTCASASVNYSVPLTSTLPNGLRKMASVGYLTPNAASGNLDTYTIDTGSLGTIITADDLPSRVNTLVIGPGNPGVKCYDSSNNAYFGNYYLAPVDIQVKSGGGTTTVQTNPLMVLGATKYCSVNNCTSQTPIGSCTTTPSIHYMGVGFYKNFGVPGDLFISPTANAFLHVTDANNGTDIAPGYILSISGVTLGINSTTGYNTIPRHGPRLKACARKMSSLAIAPRPMIRVIRALTSTASNAGT